MNELADYVHETTTGPGLEEHVWHMRNWPGRLLCWLGRHDYEMRQWYFRPYCDSGVVDEEDGWCELPTCRRCGLVCMMMARGPSARLRKKEGER